MIKVKKILIILWYIVIVFTQYKNNIDLVMLFTEFSKKYFYRIMKKSHFMVYYKIRFIL